MNFRILFSLGVLLLVALTVLRWINNGQIPTSFQMGRYAGQWPWATVIFLAIGIWGILRALR